MPPVTDVPSVEALNSTRSLPKEVSRPGPVYSPECLRCGGAGCRIDVFGFMAGMGAA
jgi:hypothetical protein